MPRFYVPQTFVAGEVLRLPENVCRHIQVLRLQAGAPLVLFDGQGQAAAAELLEIGRKQALARVDKLLAECGRNKVPPVAPIADLPQVLAALPVDSGARLLLSPHGGVPLRSLPPAQSAVLLIGPEGGLTAEEEDLARSHGFQAVQLGARVLRTETAAMAALAAMQALWGDF